MQMGSIALSGPVRWQVGGAGSNLWETPRNLGPGPAAAYTGWMSIDGHWRPGSDAMQARDEHYVRIGCPAFAA